MTDRKTGRKKSKNSIPKSFYISEELQKKLEDVPNESEFIREAIGEKFKELEEKTDEKKG